MPKDAPFAVEIPASGRDNPAWIKIGVIAAVGFIVGIAWPRLIGVRLGPARPGEAAAAAASASASAAAQGGRAPEAPPASVVTKGPASALPSAAPIAAAAAPAGAPPNISVQKGSVLSCKTAEGDTKKGKECGSVSALDQLVSPRVRKVASCSGALGQTGKLSLVVNVDFAAGRFSYDIGKSTTLANADAVGACLKSSFNGVSTTATAHEHPRYTVAYSAVFSPGVASPGDELAASKDRGEPPSRRAAKDAPADEKEDVAPAPAPSLASGESQVAWEVALVRDAPKTGGLVARLPRGSKVKVGSTRDGWFQIKFGEGFANDGWVYRGAIGR